MFKKVIKKTNLLFVFTILCGTAKKSYKVERDFDMLFLGNRKRENKNFTVIFHLVQDPGHSEFGIYTKSLRNIF